MRVAIGAVAAAALFFVVSPVFAASDCQEARCLVQSEVDARCPCTDATNHGQHVSCVAHVVRDLARQDPPAIPTNCKGKVTRCAARSTCGKEGFVTCTVAVSTCDTTTGTCVNDPSVSCTADADCGTRCSTKSSGDKCPAPGVVGSGTCCPSCD